MLCFLMDRRLVIILLSILMPNWLSTDRSFQ